MTPLFLAALTMTLNTDSIQRIPITFGLGRSIQTGSPGIAIVGHDTLRIYDWDGQLKMYNEEFEHVPVGVTSDGEIIFRSPTPEILINSEYEKSYLNANNSRFVYYGYAKVEFNKKSIKIGWADSVEASLPPTRNHVIPLKDRRVVISTEKWESSAGYFHSLNAITGKEISIPLTDESGNQLLRISDEICKLDAHYIGLYVVSNLIDRNSVKNLMQLGKQEPEMLDHFKEAVFVKVDTQTGLCKPIFSNVIEVPNDNGRRRMLPWQTSMDYYKGKLAVLGYQNLYIINLD